MRIYKTGAVANDANESGGVDQLQVVEIFCTSLETKPTDGIADGSIAVEIDTGKVYFFNETTGLWVEQFSFQS